MKQVIGEAQITPQLLQHVAPDVISPQGLNTLHQTMTGAALAKKQLDTQLEQIAKKTGSEFSSRIKNVHTVVQKIAQKRLEGRRYDTNDINDAYGGRFIVESKKEVPQILSLVKKLADKEGFKVIKSEDVKSGTYHAKHVDFSLPSGVKGEVQVMTPQEALEAVSNHSLRAVSGEKAQGSEALLRNRQATLAKQTPNKEAKQKISAIQEAAKQNNDNPTDPRVNASILAQ